MALVACGGTPPPEPAPTRPAAGTLRPVPPTPAPVSRVVGSFSDELRGMATADLDGPRPIAFAAENTDASLAAAVGGTCRQLVPDDVDTLRPTFRCSGPIVPARDAERLTARFAGLRSEIGACLAAGGTLDAWQEAPVVDFVGPERQALWQDAASWPRRIVLLRVEPAGDPVRPDYRLALETTRSTGRRVW